MTDQRLRELLEERVADTTSIDLAAGAWERASAVRRRRRAIAGAVVAVVAVVGTTTVVVSGGGDAPPPPADNTTGPSAPGPKAERAGRYAGVPVWWAPSVADEADLPDLTGTALPPEIDLSEGAPPVPAGVRAIGLFQLWGDEPGRVVVVGADGASYSLDVGHLKPIHAPTSGVRLLLPPVMQESLSPDGRYAFFGQPNSLAVYDFEDATWTSIETRRSAGAARWSADGTAIQIQDGLYSTPLFDLYSPSGQHLGTTRESEGIYVGPRAGDEFYGAVRRSENGEGARGLFLAGPVSDNDLGKLSSVDALGAAGRTEPDALLAFPRNGADEGRWLQCCSPVGWLDEDTVLFESRHGDARILAWRVGTPDTWRVSDIRGWTPGEESYVASFAAVDGSVEVEPTPEIEADGEFEGVPIWWSPDAAGEAELPWLDQSVLPRDIDVEAGLQIAPEVEPGNVPFDRAVAAFPYPNTVEPDWMFIVGSDGPIAKLDVGRLDVYPAPNDPGEDIATRATLAPDGRHLVFPQAGGFMVFDIGSSTWSAIEVPDTDTSWFGWRNASTIVVTGDDPYAGPAYDLSGDLVSERSELSQPVFLFATQAAQRDLPVTGPHGNTAQLWYDDGSLEIPQDGARYASAPLFIAVTGSGGDHVLGLVERRGAERNTYLGPRVVGWLDEQTVVYESISDHGHFVVAWRVGTHDFWKVADLEGAATGSFNGRGGPSFADLSP
jgi:hypothetical protein